MADPGLVRDVNRVRLEGQAREQLVLVRPYGDDGLLLHQLYYENEVRQFDDIDLGARFDFSDVERELALKLIDQLSTEEFDPGKYSDGYEERVRTAVEQKVSGQEVTVAPEAPKAQIIDLFEALKKSLADAQNDEAKPIKPPKKAAPKKAASKRAKAKKSG